MTLELPEDILSQIHGHAETTYPEEGAGILLGTVNGHRRQVKTILTFMNAREHGTRHNRYLITPQDMLSAEQEAERRGLDVIGIFHSHPDHPGQPSEFDRQWALPWFSYLITSVIAGQAVASQSWRLSDERQHFEEEPIHIQP